MEWKELIQKFEALGKFFAREYECMPLRVAKEIWAEKNISPISIPISFKTKEGKEIAAKMRLATSGRISIWPKRKVSKDLAMLGVPVCMELVNPASTSFEPSGSYESCVHQIATLLSVNLYSGIAGVIIERAYYDLRYAIENHFKRINKLASKEEKMYWNVKRRLSRTVKGLAEIAKICDESRKTVGKSYTLASIRKEAEAALQETLTYCYPIQADDDEVIPSLPD